MYAINSTRRFRVASKNYDRNSYRGTILLSTRLFNSHHKFWKQYYNRVRPQRYFFPLCRGGDGGGSRNRFLRRSMLFPPLDCKLNPAYNTIMVITQLDRAQRGVSTRENPSTTRSIRPVSHGSRSGEQRVSWHRGRYRGIPLSK